MGAWFAGVLAMVITYLVKDYLSQFFKWSISKWNEYQQTMDENKRINDNLQKIKEDKTDEERRKDIENLLNDN